MEFDIFFKARILFIQVYLLEGTTLAVTPKRVNFPGGHQDRILEKLRELNRTDFKM